MLTSILTGDGHGEVEADDKDFSLSSGSSTELIRMFRADNKRLPPCTGLDGAVKAITVRLVSCSTSR